MKFISWNVNGIRAIEKKGFLDWFRQSQADIVCLQETKANPEQLSENLLHPEGYFSVFHSAQKKGYSGVAIYSKREPMEIRLGLGSEEFDSEGRVLIADFGKFHLINAYFPNSQREHTRLPYKLRFCEAILKTCEDLRAKGKNLILCGDYNIAHREIDLKNPKANEDNAGFLPEERRWMDKFIVEKGYIDTFRIYEKGPGHYTWWSFRPGVREKNIGWRIDYFCINPEFQDAVQGSRHHQNVMGSDHCPIELNLKHEG